MSSEEKITQLALDIWKSKFSDGAEVVLEDDCGEFHWGRLKNYDWGIRLLRIGGKKALTLEWDEIVFIAQDGFPVREIMGMSYEEAVMLCDSTPTEIIREKLLALTNQKKAPVIKSSRSSSSSPVSYRSFGGGCPFVFDDVRVVDVLNPGNNGPKWWGDGEAEETLILQGRNGATMFSYDMSHLFFFDGLEREMGVPVYDKAMSFNQKQW